MALFATSWEIEAISDTLIQSERCKYVCTGYTLFSIINSMINFESIFSQQEVKINFFYKTSLLSCDIFLASYCCKSIITFLNVFIYLKSYFSLISELICLIFSKSIHLSNNESQAKISLKSIWNKLKRRSHYIVHKSDLILYRLQYSR